MSKRPGSPETWTIEIFNNKVVKDEKGCWYLPSNTTRAAQVSYRLFKGVKPKNMCICHTCDNPPCCNPDHLWLGTLAENNRDRAAKNRSYRPLGDLNVMKRSDLREKRKGSGNPFYGKHHTKEAKARIASSNTGIPRTESERASISNGTKNVPGIPCCYCGRVLKPWSLARWHGENCKMKRQVVDTQEPAVSS